MKKIGLQPISRSCVSDLKRTACLQLLINEKVPLKVGEEMAFFNEIESKRKSLIDLALKHGLNSDVTLKCSQELDHLLLQEIKHRQSHLQNIHKKSKTS
ncbi:aspartyl-phosphate phosphatase Spo0E family protein [Metabacillus sp. 84]|uniref:aspartyl-phosphate phosphatase Spo0E family protein n=1 Tax=unclassified Metabacillus TaxID=2675274 RepID=UPI003CE71B98